MEGSVLSQVVLPLVLSFIMFGMGMSLTRDDFSRLLRMPLAVVAGLVGQIILLPLLAFGLVLVLDLPVYLAIGIMVLAACPGGTTSNLFSHVARANLALSITLTAIATVICVFTTPFIVEFSLRYFEVKNQSFSVLDMTLKMIVLLLVPVLVGLFVRHKAPMFALRQEHLFRKLSVSFMLLMIAGISWQERDMLAQSFPNVFILTIALNVLATLMGVAIAKLVMLSKRDAITLGIEIGTQNATMAIIISLTFLADPTYSIACGVYGVTMYLGATALVFWSKSGAQQSQD
ncbi:bile acid:sodium symporter family protein [Alteromonas sp. ASW11-36]|uniref:Bile acid:sodium symporter family protein n=1 Tax=Alteromonas arenosi TaxID=3055817 RepID=A0ABT7STT2_9ALTE|nr:bile acid:sodium symporter family protein [Alteromonas sp. ASW11-36]MDM7859600.1 bile acid:sodium symporter family protein [Alteromonas sp. ASW11-36]